MTVLVLNFHHRGPFNQPIPTWIRKFILEKLKRFLGMKLMHFGADSGCNGVIRKMSTRLQLDDIVLGNNMADHAEKELFQVCFFLLIIFASKIDFF